MSSDKAFWREWNIHTLFGRTEMNAVWTLCTYQNTLKQWARSLETGRNFGLVLCGEPKKGKTMSIVLCAILIRLMGASLAMWSAHRLSEFLRDPQRSDSELRELSNVDFMILDDVGREYSTEWTSSALDRILLCRHSEQRPVLLTSNVSYNDMRLRGWERMVWRILDMAYAWVES